MVIHNIYSQIQYLLFSWVLAWVYFYHKFALEVFFWIYLFTGFWVWIIARDAYHIGASGLVYGLTSFLLFSGFFRKDSKSIAISFVIIFLHHSMVYGLIPGDEAISYESHIMGTVAGLICAFLYRRSPLKDAQLLELSEVDSGFDLDQGKCIFTPLLMIHLCKFVITISKMKINQMQIVIFETKRLI